MNEADHERELSDIVLEVGGRLCPRRYQRFRDLRSSDEASEWAKKLEWRDNPYDRFLLRREILRQLESSAIHEPGFKNVYTYASRDEIAAEVDGLMRTFPDKYESIGVLDYVLITLPWHLAFKHGRVWRDPLVAALNAREMKKNPKG